MVNRNKARLIRSRTTGGILIGVIGFLIIGIFVGEPAITAFQETNPPLPDEFFEIPFNEDEAIINNDEILDQVDNIILNPDQFCGDALQTTFISVGDVAIEYQLNAECLVLTQGEEFVTDLGGEGSVPNTPCAEVQTIEPECQGNLEIIIDNLGDDLIIPDPITNQTDFSEDPLLDQIGDIVNDTEIIDAILPSSNSIQLVVKTLKITSDGQMFESIVSFDVPQASFLVEDSTNIDFESGTINIELFAETEPNRFLIGNGKFDILVAGQSIFPNELGLHIEGTTGANGLTDVFIVSPSGIPSDIFRFQFADHFDKFPNEQVSKIEVKVSQLDIRDNTDFDFQPEFSVSDLTVFTMDIARDDTQILIEGESGGKVRVFPSDSRIVVTSKTSRTDSYLTGLIRQQTFCSDFLGNGLGCTQQYLCSTVTRVPSTVNKGVIISAPTISGISVIDSQGTILESGSTSSGVPFDTANTLTRSANYTLNINSVGISSELEFGKAQETKSFSCIQEGTANTKAITTTSGSFTACGTSYRTTTQVLDTANPVTLGAKSCNVP